MDNKLPKPDKIRVFKKRAHRRPLLMDFVCRLVGWIFFSFWPIYRAFLFTYSSHVGTFIFKGNNFVSTYSIVFQRYYANRIRIEYF